jgi:hypothetical protein
LRRIRQLQFEHVRALSAIVASSRQSECVGSYAARLLDLADADDNVFAGHELPLRALRGPRATPRGVGSSAARRRQKEGAAVTPGDTRQSDHCLLVQQPVFFEFLASRRDIATLAEWGVGWLARWTPARTLVYGP